MINTDQKKLIGARLRHSREHAGLQQNGVAKKIGVHPSTLNKYESGEREPNADILAQLAALYGVTLDYLITGKETAPRKSTGNLFPGGVIGRGRPDEDVEDLLSPDEEERLRRLLEDPELSVAFRKGALAKNVSKRRLLKTLESLVDDEDEEGE